MLEKSEDRGNWRGLCHPDSVDCHPNKVGPFIPAYAIAGVAEFAFRFRAETLSDVGRETPGMARTRTIAYDGPFGGTTPHFVALRSFSGKFVTGKGELTDRPLGAFAVDVGIKEPGTLACTIRLSDKNSDDPVEVNVRGVIVFFQ